MLNALYELGKLWIEKENLEKIDVLLDAEKLKKNTKKVILVELDQISENQFDFNRVSIKEYDSIDNSKYLYKSGSSRGTDITPSCLITETEKTFNNKFIKWFKQNNNDEFLNSILDCLLCNKEVIYDEIKKQYNNLDNKNNKNVILTLVINNSQKYYLGDFDIFKEILIEKSSIKYYKSNSKEIKGKSTCFLCNNHKEVYGLVSSSIGFAFSTADKKGNLPKLNINNQWKQLPICGECALYLEAGKKFVEKYLSFKEFGLNYYVIPNFLFESEKDFDTLFKRIKHFEDKEKYEDVVNQENKLKSIFEKLDNVLEFKFLFFEAKNSAFNILAYTESILPSWMNKIFKEQTEIIGLELFSEDYLKKIISKNNEGDLIKTINSYEKYYPINEFNWYLGFLRIFYRNYSFKYYLEMVCSVINEKKIDFSFLLSNIMEVIRNKWRNQNENSMKHNILESLALILLFNNLNLYKGGKIMELEDSKLTEDLIKNILNSSDKKATFLLGVLTRKLVYIQYKEMHSTPFINKLWGLSLDKKKIQKLYPMVLNKLQEYKKGHWFSDIQKEISINLINSENNWNLTRDETSYYFVLGYTLAFAIDNEEKKEI